MIFIPKKKARDRLDVIAAEGPLILTIFMMGVKAML